MTGGNLDVTTTGISHFGSLDISGARGFTLRGTTDTLGFFAPVRCVTACDPGSLLSVDAIWSGIDIHPTTATLDGRTFTEFGMGEGDAGAHIEFRGAVALPDALMPSAVVSGPFRFGGFFHPGDAASIGLFGRGTATVFLEHLILPSSGINGWTVNRVRYDFSSMPGDPIPEPATMLLVGAGLGGAMLQRARRRAARRS